MKRRPGLIVLFVALLSWILGGSAEAVTRYIWGFYSPDGESIYVSRHNGFDILDAKSGKVRYRRATYRYHVASFSGDGKSVVFAESHGPNVFVREVDSKTGKEILSYNTKVINDSEFWTMSALTDRLFVTASLNGEIIVWKRGARNPERIFESGLYPMHVLPGPDEDQITIIRYFGDIERYQLSTGRLLMSKDILEFSINGAYTRNNRSLLILGAPKSAQHDYIYSFDARSLKFRAVLPEHSNAISVGDNTFAECRRRQNTVNVRRFSLELKKAIPLPYPCGGAAMSPDSEHVLTIGKEPSRVDVWDVDSGRIVWTHWGDEAAPPAR